MASKKKELRTEVVLVGIVIDDYGLTRNQAQKRVIDMMNGLFEKGEMDEWWIAEDDRIDGSDNSSAVFLPCGISDPRVMRQGDAVALLGAAMKMNLGTMGK